VKSKTAPGEWTDHLGRPAGTEYKDNFGRIRVVSPPEFHHDDGTVVYGHEANAAASAYWDGVEEHKRRVLAQLKPHELARFETWLRTRTHATPPVRLPSRPAAGHAPREARNDRRRGSRRGERSRSSSRDDPDPEPSRVCGCGCGEGISHLRPQALYLNETHRKRAQRARDRHDPERVLERTAAPGKQRRCRCRGQAAYPYDHRWICCACGRPKAGLYSEVNGRLATREVLDILAEEARRGAHTPALAREWRTRPTRELSAQLRKPRGRWDQPAPEEVVA
jgi:hypothetical protein